MLTWLSSIVVHPWLLAGGALLVGVPILIHLLNKRRFQIVDWAAIDFLIEAEKLNRRRVRLEDLLLLLLRCLAVLLIGLLLARPFWSAQTAGRFVGTRQYERIFVVDDSLSMNARAGAATPLDLAKEELSRFVSELVANNTKNTVTVWLASQAERPLVNGVALNEDTMPDILQQIDEITASDARVDFGRALQEVERSLSARENEINRAVYLMTDLRRRDWPADDTDESGSSDAIADERTGALSDDPIPVLRRMSDKVTGLYVVDWGSDEVGNLVVESIEAVEKAVISGVTSRFEVTVRNTAEEDVSDVDVRFRAGAFVPLQGTIDTIPAGGTAMLPFSFTFARSDPMRPDQDPPPVPIEARIDTTRKDRPDRLDDDDVRYFSAQVVRGIRTLVVDGEPSASYGRAETFYLAKALAPRGTVLSGLSVDVVTDVEFDAIDLDDFQVVFLCNLYQINAARRESLEAWVRAGGGLIVVLGDQVDELLYNQQWHRDGQGLLPVRLVEVRGDLERQTWMHLQPRAANHPVLRIFEGENNPLLESVKIFRWWSSYVVPEQQAAGEVTVLATLTDADNSPALIEGRFGAGRVMAVCTALDLDWNNWVQDAPSYLITMQELARYMAPAFVNQANIQVAQPLQQPVDLTQYEMDVTVRRPDDRSEGLQPRAANGDDSATHTAIWMATYDQTQRRGFYEMQLTNKDDGSTHSHLFAANIDPSEGDLKRSEVGLLQNRMGDATVEFVTGASLSGLSTDANKSELWRLVFGCLMVVMCGELLFGCWLGRRR